MVLMRRAAPPRPLSAKGRARERTQQSAWYVMSDSDVCEMKILNHACHRVHLLQRLQRKGSAFAARIPGNRNREQMYLVSLLSEARFLSGMLYF